MILRTWRVVSVIALFAASALRAGFPEGEGFVEHLISERLHLSLWSRGRGHRSGRYRCDDVGLHDPRFAGARRPALVSRTPAPVISSLTSSGKRTGPDGMSATGSPI